MLALSRCRWRPPPNVFLRTIETAQSAETKGKVQNLLDYLEDGPPKAGPDGYPPPNPLEPSKAITNPMSQEDQKTYGEKKPIYRLYCQATRNNTITTLVDDKCHPIASFSGGSCGFKGVNRSGYEAGYQCAVHIFRLIVQKKQEREKANKERFEIHLFFNGFGQGRDAMHKALLTSEGETVRKMINAITDRTPIKIGGTRAKKTRRL